MVEPLVVEVAAAEVLMAALLPQEQAALNQPVGQVVQEVRGLEGTEQGLRVRGIVVQQEEMEALAVAAAVQEGSAPIPLQLATAATAALILHGMRLMGLAAAAQVQAV